MPSPEPYQEHQPSRWEKLQLLRGKLTRSDTNRWIAGLAAGIGARIGISTGYVRAAFVVLALGGGAGIILYLIGWIITPDAKDYGRMIVAERPATRQEKLALAVAFVALLLLLGGIGPGPTETVLAIALVVFGAALVWDRGGLEYGRKLAGLTKAPEEGGLEHSRLRFIGGAALLIGGIVVLLATVDAVPSLVIATALAGAGFMLLFGPWVWQMAGDLAAERRARIRSEERTEMAAHLHDSVLQTLALIQRTDDPKKMVTLARAQERELRDWLYQNDEPESNGTIRSALEEAASRIESAHDVPIDVVVVGDCSLSEDVQALVAASTEAMTNASKHSGTAKVSVFAECEDGAVDVWISDQGSGFDLDAVPEDRMGISESIRGRMERVGGTVEIQTSAEQGTEVHLSMKAEQP
jgi:signal transduction histidine kinase/phage shock protein PspC (stress-responsive transcriptional regulator)